MTINSRRPDFIVKKGIWKGNALWNLYQRHKHHLSGKKNYLFMQKKLELNVLVLL